MWSKEGYLKRNDYFVSMFLPIRLSQGALAYRLTISEPFLGLVSGGLLWLLVSNLDAANVRFLRRMVLILCLLGLILVNEFDL